MSHTRKATERGSDVCRLGSFMGPKWGPRVSSFYTLRRGLPTRSPAKASRLAHPSHPSGRRVSDTLALLLPWSGGGRHHRGPPRGLPSSGVCTVHPGQWAFYVCGLPCLLPIYQNMFIVTNVCESIRTLLVITPSSPHSSPWFLVACFPTRFTLTFNSFSNWWAMDVSYISKYNIK